MNHPIILLTDFGNNDLYAGVLRGVIQTRHPQARVLVLTHGIAPFNIIEAAHVLEAAYPYFPRGSIFVCVVDPGVGTRRKILCLRTARHTFLAPDNGLLDLVKRRERKIQIRSVENKSFFAKDLSATFHGRDIFAPVAAALSRRDVFKRLGPAVKSIAPLAVPEPRKNRGLLEGEVIYFDHYGNAVTNLRRAHAAQKEWERAAVYQGTRRLGPLAQTYGSARPGLTALFDSFGRLELAWPHGSARAQSRLRAGSKVSVVYGTKK